MYSIYLETRKSIYFKKVNLEKLGRLFSYNLDFFWIFMINQGVRFIPNFIKGIRLHKLYAKQLVLYIANWKKGIHLNY